jgi:hypothetical protein
VHVNRFFVREMLMAFGGGVPDAGSGIVDRKRAVLEDDGILLLCRTDLQVIFLQKYPTGALATLTITF